MLIRTSNEKCRHGDWSESVTGAVSRANAWEAGFAAHRRSVATEGLPVASWALPAYGTSTAAVRAKGAFQVPGPSNEAVLWPRGSPTLKNCVTVHRTYIIHTISYATQLHWLRIVTRCGCNRNRNSDYHATRRSSDAEPCKCWVSVEKLTNTAAMDFRPLLSFPA